MNRFSVIIPFLGDQNSFEDTLATLLRHKPASCEFIVAHDGTYDDRYQVASEVTLVTSQRRAHLIRLFNCGLRVARGEIVGLIRPGIELDENWQLPVEEAFANPCVGSVTPLIVSPRKPNTIVSAGVKRISGYRRGNVGSGKSISRSQRLWSSLGPTGWAAFYRRSALDELGTPDQSLDPVYLDLDIALGLNALGFSSVVATELLVNLDRPIPMLREFETPHGLSAQRAVARHSREGSLSSLLQASFWELLGSPVKPWMFQHLAQRYGARQYESVDHAFRQRIKTRRSLLDIDRQEIPSTGRHAA